MFDKQKMKQLEQRSHNRGLLSKQFYSNQQQEIERKRLQMKAELDRQVEQRRRKKQQQKLQNQRRIQKQEEQIKNYYKNLQNRQKKISINESNIQNSNMKMAQQPYQTYPVESQIQSRYKNNVNQYKGKIQSKTNLNQNVDIPLLPVMQAEYNQSLNPQQQQSSILAMSKQSFQNLGNIPLLDLGQETLNPKNKQKKPKPSKRQKTLQNQKSRQINTNNMNQIINNQQGSNVIHNSPPTYVNARQERKSTNFDEQSIYGSIVHKQNEKRNTEIEQEIQEIQQQNKSLKNQLKKNQEALTLLIGAVRSNGKFDKFRSQAQRILRSGVSQNVQQQQKQQNRSQQKLMLPKINLKHQSIMHDYLINAARRVKKGTN